MMTIVPGLRFPPPLSEWSAIGTPTLSFLDKPVSFYAIARLAYENEVFAEEDGLEMLGDIAEAAKKSKPAESMMIEGPYDDQAAMVAKAKSVASDLTKEKAMTFVAGLTQSEKQLTGNILTEKTVVDWDKLAKQELVDMVDDYKARVITAEDRCIELDLVVGVRDNTIVELETQVGALKVELADAKKAQAAFMASSDKSAVVAKHAVDGTANDIFNILKPFIRDELAPLRTSLASSASMLDALKISCDEIPLVKDSVLKLVTDTPRSLDMLTSVTEANGEASEESFAAFKSALDNCGITAQTEAFDLPRSLTFVVEAVRNLSPPSEPKPPIAHDGPCAYQVVDGQPGSLGCTLGCASMLQFANTTMAQADTSFAQDSQPQSVLMSNQFQFPPPNYTPVKTVQGHGQGVQGGGIQKKKHQRNKQNKQNLNQQTRLTHQNSGLVTYTGNNAYQVVETSPVVRQLQPQQQLRHQLQSQQQHQLLTQQQQFVPVYVQPIPNKNTFVGGASSSFVSVSHLPLPVTTQAGRGRGTITHGK